MRAAYYEKNGAATFFLLGEVALKQSGGFADDAEGLRRRRQIVSTKATNLNLGMSVNHDG